MIEEEIRISNSGAPDIRADIRSESPSAPLPVIILSHGFLGYKGWGWFPFVARSLAAAGFHTVTFSYSMNGYDESSGTISRPDEFAANTVSRELNDLRTVIDYVRGSLPLAAEPGRIGLFGHSRGGAVSILAAPGNSSVKSLVTWSTPSRLDRYTGRRKREWKREGKLPFRDRRSEDPLYLDYSYYIDIDSNRERYSLPERMEKIDIPHLIIHGGRDAAVTLREAKRLISRTGTGRVKFEIIEGCGHTFGIADRMKYPPPEPLQAAVDRTEEWFCETLAG